LRWRLNLTLQISQGSASTYFRWSGQFSHSFVKGLFRDNPSNFYWNRFIFDREGAKNKLAQFFWDTVYISSACKFPTVYMCQKLWKLAGSRQSYCKNYQAYFFGPSCTEQWYFTSKTNFSFTYSSVLQELISVLASRLILILTHFQFSNNFTYSFSSVNAIISV